MKLSKKNLHTVQFNYSLLFSDKKTKKTSNALVRDTSSGILLLLLFWPLPGLFDIILILKICWLILHVAMDGCILAVNVGLLDGVLHCLMWFGVSLFQRGLDGFVFVSVRVFVCMWSCQCRGHACVNSMNSSLRWGPAFICFFPCYTVLWSCW